MRVIDDNLEFFINVLMKRVALICSPYEICPDIDFPNKDEFGGIVLRFIGGGAAYLKIQSELPSDEEVRSVYEIGKYLQKEYGDYTVINVLCKPHIELQKINIVVDEHLPMTYISLRKEDGDGVLKRLSETLEKNEDFTVDDHIQRCLLPYMGRSDDNMFEENYKKFKSIYDKSNIELPTVEDLISNRVIFQRIF